MKRRYLLSVLFSLIYFMPVNAQSFAINTDGSAANASAILDVKSITKGMLIPRMFMFQRDLIAAPSTGLIIYQTDNTPGFYYYDGIAWVSLVSSTNSLWLQSGSHIYNSNPGYVGIGTSTPLARLHVADGAVLFDNATGGTPVSGSGTRMMWIPAKAAFRAGTVFSTQWDNAAIGQYSIAMGSNTIASGFYSTAIGDGTSASGNSSTALGSGTTASATASTAMGGSTIASGLYSTASGSSTIASGDNATAMGSLSTASGNISTAIGFFLKSKSYGGFVTGIFNDTTNAASATVSNNLNRIFQVGNGTFDFARSNAMTILQSGNVGIGTTTPVALLQVRQGPVLFDGNSGGTSASGAGTRLMWIPNKAAFRAGKVTATEWDDVNIGLNSLAIGSDNTASGISSSTIGSNSIASGNYAASIGTYNSATGIGSVAVGYFSTSSGYYSGAMGLQLKSKSFSGFVTGQYNDSTNAANATTYNNLNRIFQVGNGIADNARDNAMTILQSGNTGIGTATPLALLQVKRGAVLFDSTLGGTPVNGAGTRMMWIPAKAAFRAGIVFTNEWDDVNIGQYSVALGFGNKASGNSTTALGSMSTVSGNFSTSIGVLQNVTGEAAMVIGYRNSASGDYAIALGQQNSASGDSSIAMGYLSTASGSNSTSLGLKLRSKSFAGFVTGLYNDSTNAANGLTINNSNRIFQVGNGTADNARSNAMTILQNGNVGIGVLAPSQQLEVANNITVQNGKGILRGIDGTQRKQLSANVSINATFTAGETKTFAITWPESFSSTPDAFVSNVVSGAGGWAEIVLTITNPSTTGATLYAYNPKTISVSPNYTIKILAIGPQ